MSTDFGDEVIQVLVTLLEEVLHLERRIVIITDQEHWLMMFPEDKPFFDKKYRKTHDVFGLAHKDRAYIFINLDDCKTFKDIVGTLIHEMAHISLDTDDEDRIERLERKYLK